MRHPESRHSTTQPVTHSTRIAPAPAWPVVPQAATSLLAPALPHFTGPSHNNPLSDANVATESAPEVPPPDSAQGPALTPAFDVQAVQSGQLRAVMYALFVNASGDNKHISAPTIIRLLFDRGLIIEHTTRSNAPKQTGNQMVTLRNVDLSQSEAHQKYAARVGSLLISKIKGHMNGLERIGKSKSVAYRINADFAQALGAKLFS